MRLRLLSWLRNRFWHWYGRYLRGELPTFGRCPYCERWRVRHYVQTMTRYVDDKLNEVPKLCHDCREEYREYWQAMWDDYYAGCL